MSRLPARLAVLALLVAGAASVRADGLEAPASEVWIHDVGDLTYGRACFPGEQGPFLAPDQVNEEEHPLFGGVGEEFVWPLGTAMDVLEELKAEVLGRDAGSVWAHSQGESKLLVGAPRAVQDRIASILDRLRAAVLPSLSLDVAFFEGDPVLALGSDSLVAAIADGRLRLLGATRIVGLVSNESATFVGRERTFVEGLYVEVASEARTYDPIVGVFPEGARVEARLLALEPEPLVEIEAWVTRHEDVRRVRTGRGDAMDLPVIDAATVQALVRLPPGRWTPLPMSRGRFLALRSAVEAPPRSRASDPLTADLPADAPVGPMSLATFDLHDLAAKLTSFRGPEIRLAPSWFTPPEPPELPEPRPAFSPEAVLYIAKVIDPVGWAREDAHLSLRHDRLRVRHDEAHRKAVAGIVETLRARYVGTTRLSATVVRLPLASFPEFFRDGAAADASRFLSRPGAEVLDRIAVHVPRAGGRRADWHGRERSYLADIDVEIAQGAVIGNPIEKRVLEGVVLDAEAYPACGGAAVACQIRFDRSVWQGVRTIQTEHGPVECPDLGLLRIRGGMVVPAGETRLVGVGIEGDTATLVLLTANVGD